MRLLVCMGNLPIYNWFIYFKEMCTEKNIRVEFRLNAISKYEAIAQVKQKSFHLGRLKQPEIFEGNYNLPDSA